MEARATVTSKGQITIPRAVREALDLREGDRVVFRLRGRGAVLSKVPDFLELAGTVPVAPELSGRSWREIREETWRRVARGAVGRSRRS